MKYQLLFITEIDYGEKKGNVALLYLPSPKYPQYVVVRNLDRTRGMENNDLWDSGSYYNASIKGLQRATEEYRRKTEPNFIPRFRLEELATKFKDYCYEIGEVEELEENLITEGLISIADMEDYELEFFGMEYKADEED